MANTSAGTKSNGTAYLQKRVIEFLTGIDISYKPTPTLTFIATSSFNTTQVKLQGSREGWRGYAVAEQQITEQTTTETFTQSIRNHFINPFIKFDSTQ